MISSALLRHTLVIERATAGTEDERGMPAQTWTALATVRGSVQPRSAREMAQLSQGGPVASDLTIYLLPTDVKAADRIRFDPDDGLRFQVDGVRDAAGAGRHLELDAHVVEAD
jgi:SPP1 family predicted phage head-tail adaptor